MVNGKCQACPEIGVEVGPDRPVLEEQPSLNQMAPTLPAPPVRKADAVSSFPGE